ncbi:MAG: SpoIIE family protein phosphatase [Bacteroidales bacterium]|nr:SpoIIE family protein phosphatase [Bacteroidales bacterium]
MEIKRDHILSLEIENESDVGVCRRKAVNAAVKMGFDKVKTGEIAILVSELVTNVLKHGGSKGKIVICQLEDSNNKKAIEFWCCDSGNGISNVQNAIQDGYSEKSSLGIGLGTIRRFSDELEINPVSSAEFKEKFSLESHGLNHCIRSLKWVPTKIWMGLNHKLLSGAAFRPMPGEQVNGDAYLVNHTGPDTTIISVIDGLGHGKQAHIASQLAKEQLMLKPDLPLDELMKFVHNSIRGTRGVTIGLALINTQINKISFCGIGNIESFIMTPLGKINLMSYGGICGHNIRTPRVFENDFKPGDSVCFYSDGITSRWKPEDIDWSQSPQTNAELILNQYSRPNDDATVLIVRYST